MNTGGYSGESKSLRCLRLYREQGDAQPLLDLHSSLIRNLSRLAAGQISEVPPPYSRWWLALFLGGRPALPHSLYAVKERVRSATRHLTPQDIEQQVTLFLLQLVQRWEKRPGEHNLSVYLRMVLGWRVKNWVEGLAIKMDAAADLCKTAVLDNESSYEETPGPAFTLSLHWVMAGSDQKIFSTLTPYERYLFFLHYGEEMSVRDIAAHCFYSKSTVAADLESALQKCRDAKAIPTDYLH